MNRTTLVGASPETINIAPEWKAAMQIYILVLENGNETGKKAAREDLMDLAAKLDKQNATEDAKTKLINDIKTCCSIRSVTAFLDRYEQRASK